MAHYRTNMLGRSARDGFSVSRLDGKEWIWLPVRFATRAEAEQWIRQRMTLDAIKLPARVPALNDEWR